MKLYLFGGAEMHLGEFTPQMKLIEKVIHDNQPQQILHIPFARTVCNPKEPEWEDGYFQRNIELGDIQYYNAKDDINLDELDNPMIIITGGAESLNLLEKINQNPKLLNLIQNASIIIGESSGSKILGEKARIRNHNNERVMLEGLGILKDTIIEGHYSSQKREDILKKAMNETKLKYGIGIDSCTAMIINTEKYPQEIETIGKGNSYLIEGDETIKF